jgi:hypothetical protein
VHVPSDETTTVRPFDVLVDTLPAEPPACAPMPGPVVEPETLPPPAVTELLIPPELDELLIPMAGGRSPGLR